MTNPPLFRVVPISMHGQSLLQWNEPGKTGPGALHSLQMPTEIAEHLARATNERGELLDALAFYANGDNWREIYAGNSSSSSVVECDQGDKARAALFRANRA